MKTMIEFFSGSGNMSGEFKKAGYDTLAIDLNPARKPDMVADVLNFDISELPKRFLDPSVIWFSPPCTAFSVCAIGKNFRNGFPCSSGAFLGLALAYRCLELIKILKPEFWFIENPRGMLRKQEFMPHGLRRTVTYCQYGLKCQKPTDIWSNCSSWISRKPCNAGDSCHDYQPRSYSAKVGHDVNKLGTQGLSGAFERGKIPIKLCREVVLACLGALPMKQEGLSAWGRK